MGILIIIFSLFLIAYVRKMDNLSSIEQPLFWNDITLTIGALIGVAGIIWGIVLLLV
jgi:hypothetical protein